MSASTEMKPEAAPGSLEFTPAQWSLVDEIVARHANQPGALIPVLEETQEALGYLPRAVQEKVALDMGLSPAEVFGVVSFYSFFTTRPRGRHTCRVCLGTACYVRGSQKNLDALVGMLGIAPGETTADREFSLDTIRCLGACDLAPAMVVDEETFPHVKPTKLQEILNKYQATSTAS